MKELALISGPGLEERGERILELARWMGVSARKVTLGENPTKDQLARELGGPCAAVLGAGTLNFLRDRLSAGVLREFIEEHCAQLLVWGGDSARHDGELLRWLTGDLVQGFASPEQARAFQFPENGSRVSGPFAGQSFAPERAAAVSTFAANGSSAEGNELVLLADGRPVFVRVQCGGCELFLLAANELPDIDTPLDRRDTGIAEHYGTLIPLLIFLRHSFGETCWHGMEPTGRLIIDDPLLDPAYGCLSYAALKQSMRSAGYATSIAFIPWNHWRTSKAKVARVLGQDQDLSICVHGCDHTNREFDDLDPASLQWKAATALRRMKQHELRTGVPFDPVMVFPQGKFASPALGALRASGYLAAVNTRCFPTNKDELITVRDVLRPAITKFHGFPLFQRRYPQRLINFAFDAFLGRPLLMVQHHDDFRDGYGKLEAFVDGLHRLAPNLTWGPLADQLMQSCMMRSVSEGASEVRFFTSQFRFKNSGSEPTTISFSKEEPETAAISDVLVDGTSVPFSVQGGLLTFEHQAPPGQAIEIKILDRPRHPAPASRRLGVSHTIGVCARRALSELRDKTLVKHPRLLAGATAVAKRLKVTGETGSQKDV